MGLQMHEPPKYQLSRSDVWRMVAERADLTTLLTLRKTSRAIRTLIGTYEESLCLKAALNTFPERIILRLNKTPNEATTFEWLADLVPRFLASALVDRVRFRFVDKPPRYIRCGIAAADPKGDPVRDRVAAGWRLAIRLSDTLKRVERDPKHTLEKKPKNWRSRLPEMHVKEVFAAGKEKYNQKTKFDTPIFKVVRRFFGGLSYKEIHELRLLNWYLAESISRVFLSEEVRSEKFHEEMQVTMRELEYFVFWRICRDGPLFYWQQWWEDRYDPTAKSMAEKIVKEMRTCTKDELKMGIQLGVTIRHCARPPGLPQTATDSVGFMKGYCENVYVLDTKEFDLKDPIYERIAYRTDMRPKMDNPVHLENPAGTFTHTEDRTRIAAFCFWE